MNTKVASQRSELYANIRKFFAQRNYLEVETPTLSPDLIPEPTIDNFATTFENEFIGSRELYMIPSPEVYIKKLIAEGSGSVFEISKCFRNCEQVGKIHSPEFSMLEYYTVDADEKDSIEITKKLLKETALPGCPDCVTAPWLEMTVRDAVIKYAGIDIEKNQNPKDLRERAEEKGLHIPSPEPWDDTFNRIFCTFVETSIPTDRPVLFTDYPYQIDCLAKREGFYRRRWELYIAGIEVANCYLEETSEGITRDYYRTEYQRLIELRNNTGKVIPDCDENFASYFRNFPKCSGVALGLDRLLMAETGAKDINDVLLFPLIV